MIKIGKLHIDQVEYGIQGNAILGIKESGKTYSATYFAERLMEAGIPIIAFDPIGRWRFLRVPGKGKGYKVVVAGGHAPDLPLTVARAPEIVRAAMRDGVSLVIDLYDINLSKADWRRIVTSSVKVLLHENGVHGMRHVFLEEAPEFIPQRPVDFDVYAEIEKLARMGGNCGLGYTLIGQRSQEIAKSVLELCENMFLHRQRGKNALENLDKWLAVAGAEQQKQIVDSMPSLAAGTCWAWMGGDNPRPPMLVKMPEKNSLHPSRRILRGDAETGVKPPVDVGEFVSAMRASLGKLDEEVKANDPKVLRARIAELERQVKAGAPPVDPAVIEQAERRGFEQAQKELTKQAERDVHVAQINVIEFMRTRLAPFVLGLNDEAERIKRDKPKLEIAYTPPVLPPATKPAGHPSRPVRQPPIRDANGGRDHHQHVDTGVLSGTDKRLLESLAYWRRIGFERVTRAQAAAVAGWRPTSGHLGNVAGSLKTRGLIYYPSDGEMALTAEGIDIAPQPDTSVSIVDSVMRILDGTQQKAFRFLLSCEGNPARRDMIAAGCDWSPTSGHLGNVLGSMKSLQIIDYPEDGMVAIAPWVLQ